MIGEPRRLPLPYRIARHVPIRGRGRLALDLYARSDGGVRAWHIRTTDGARVVLPVNASQTWLAAFTRHHDRAASALMRSYIKAGSLVCDVGASVGLHTVPLALAVRSVGGMVVAFEPVRGNVAYLRKNVDGNALGALVEVRAMAFGGAPGRGTMRIEGSGEGSGAGNAAVSSGVPSKALAAHTQSGGLHDQGDVLSLHWTSSCWMIRAHAA